MPISNVTIYECDRCKFQTSDKYYCDKVKDLNYTSYLKIRMPSIGIECVDSYKEKEAWLCSKCTNEFLEFMKLESNNES